MAVCCLWCVSESQSVSQSWPAFLPAVSGSSELFTACILLSRWTCGLAGLAL